MRYRLGTCRQPRLDCRQPRRIQQRRTDQKEAAADSSSVAAVCGLPAGRRVGDQLPSFNVPFMIEECPGKVQTKLYCSPALILATGILTVVDSPPPMTLLAAITRLSPALT